MCGVFLVAAQLEVDRTLLLSISIHAFVSYILLGGKTSIEKALAVRLKVSHSIVRPLCRRNGACNFRFEFLSAKHHLTSNGHHPPIPFVLPSQSVHSTSLMYPESSRKDNHTHSILDRLSANTAHSDSHRILTAGEDNVLPTRSAVSLTDEQETSAALQGEELDDVDVLSPRAVSIQYSPRSSPIPANSTPVMSSPAAMFLTAFSPIVKPIASPDSEGEYVSGYRLGKIIGQGGFSIIREASSQAGGMVAVKIVRHSELRKQPNAASARRRLDHEATVWASLNHEHILPLFSAEHTAFADFYFTILCPAGSLYDILKREGRPALPHDDVGMMFRQVVRGVRYLHETAGIVHRDMKLENVLIDEMGGCRIGDFGMAKAIGEGLEDSDIEEETAEITTVGVQRATSLAVPQRRMIKRGISTQHLSLKGHGPMRHRYSTASNQMHGQHYCQPGSLPYAAPEILSGHRQPANPAQDIWALGVMLHVMLTGQFPFNDSFEPRLQFKILNSESSTKLFSLVFTYSSFEAGVYEPPARVGLGAERVLIGCLEKTVNSRWSIASVDEASWGVGWGSDGDTAVSSAVATPALEDPSYLLYDQGNSRSPSSIRGTSASRRSLSRAKRSLSRGPLDRTNRHLHSSPAVLDYPRGRTLTKSKAPDSRSASPSEAPRTPLDSLSPVQSVRFEPLFEDEISSVLADERGATYKEDLYKTTSDQDSVQGLHHFLQHHSVRSGSVSTRLSNRSPSIGQSADALRL